MHPQIDISEYFWISRHSSYSEKMRWGRGCENTTLICVTYLPNLFEHCLFNCFLSSQNWISVRLSLSEAELRILIQIIQDSFKQLRLSVLRSQRPFSTTLLWQKKHSILDVWQGSECASAIKNLRKSSSINRTLWNSDTGYFFPFSF